jgi:autotransporter-associated beta strand protein
MNRPSSHKTIRVAGLLAAMTLAASLTPIHAATLYWDAATSSSWHTATNWSTDLAGDTQSAAVPTSGDDLIFNSTPFNGASNATAISQDIAARSLTFASGNTVRLSQNNSTRILSLGAGGITVNNGSGGITIGESSGSLFTEATTNQTWTNNSANTLTVRRLRASNNAAGDVTVTLSVNGNSTNNLLTFANSISDSADGTKKLAIVIDSAGTGGVTLLASGTPTAGGAWTGGTTVKRGVLAASTTTIGSGSITLGHTSGSETATLRIGTNAGFTSNLTVQANSGTNILEFTSTSTGSSASSAITLNGNLNVGVRNVTGGTTLSGVISGSGDLIKGTYQGSATTGLLTLSGANTYSGDTTINNGAFTLAETGSLTFYIGANGVNNQVNGISTGAVAFNGTFNLDLTNAAAANGNSWTLVSLAAVETYGVGFSFANFSDADNDNVWTNGGWSFSEATGILSYSAIPEPSTYALLAGAGFLAYAGIRRKGRRSAS